MGKARIAVVSDLSKESPPTYGPEVIHVMTPCKQPRQDAEADHGGAVVWYVISILSTICCFFPCNIIGLVHAMISKHEAERGNIAAHKRRLYQAKCWTGWSIGLGLATLVTLLILASVCSGRMYQMGKGGPGRWKSVADFDEDDRKPEYMRQGQKDGKPQHKTTPHSKTTTASAQPVNSGFAGVIGELIESWDDSEEEDRDQASSPPPSAPYDESDESSSSDCSGYGCGSHRGSGRGSGRGGGHGGGRGGGRRGGHRGGYGGYDG